MFVCVCVCVWRGGGTVGGKMIIPSIEVINRYIFTNGKIILKKLMFSCQFVHSEELLNSSFMDIIGLSAISNLSHCLVVLKQLTQSFGYRR